MSWENLILEKEDGIGILKINRPKALNALNAAVMADLENCLPQIAADPEIKVLIITGEGDRSFVGGGDELAIACDIRVASTKAKFGQPEVGLGITPGFGGTQRLPRLIGQGRARYLLYTADIIDAQKALEWGLVDFVAEPEALMDTAKNIAKKIIKQRQFAVQETKQCALRGIEAPLKTALEFEAQAFGLCFSNPDQKEAMANFLNKSKK